MAHNNGFLVNKVNPFHSRLKASIPSAPVRHTGRDHVTSLLSEAKMENIASLTLSVRANQLAWGTLTVAFGCATCDAHSNDGIIIP